LEFFVIWNLELVLCNSWCETRYGDYIEIHKWDKEGMEVERERERRGHAVLEGEF